MDFVLFYRVIAVAIVLNWLVQFALTISKPADWEPRGAERVPVRLYKRRYLVICVLGMLAGSVVLGFSFVFFK